MFLVISKKVVTLLGIGVVALIAVIGILGLFLRDDTTATSADGNWGLSFQTAGEPPVANVTAEELAEYNAYYIDKTDEKVMYLTFDAGYENGHTEKILDTLKKHQVSATFFLVGNYIASEPELVKRMVEEGHTVGNHTYNHPDMSQISTLEDFTAELESLEELYEKTVGQEMLKLYRPPQGKFSETNLKMAKELGYTTVFWSLAYVDWYENQQPSTGEALMKLIPRMHPGAIVLLHSTSSTNAEVLDQLITKWKDQGYEIRSLTELVDSDLKKGEGND